MAYLEGFAKKSNDLESKMKKLTTALEKLVKEANKRADNLAKDKAADEEIQKANKVYDMACAYQTATLKENQEVMNAVKAEYKQYKAAFMKAVSAGESKLKEEAAYLEAVAEAAEQEVEDVITGAISKEELSDLCNATKNVKDADVSDDPDKLVADYGRDMGDGSVKTAGTVDTEINSKSESAMFSGFLY